MFHRSTYCRALLTGSLGLAALASVAVSATAAPVAAASVSSTAAAGMAYQGSSAHTDTTFTVEGSLFRIVDSGPITPGVGCSQASGNPHAALCLAPKNPDGTFKTFRAHALGGNDYLRNSSPAGMIGDGGSGGDSVVGSDTAADTLSGGEDGDTVVGRGGSDRLYGNSQERPYGTLGDDTLSGGLGADTLVGGWGDDTLRGGDGDDRFVSGTVSDGSDDIRGDVGRDSVDYTSRTRQIEVTLTNPDLWSSGESGERDRIRDVEDAAGSLEAPNYLIGSSGANRLSGGDGKDWIVGGGGADRLTGSGENDTLFTGGLFPDPIADGSPDTASGGSGADTCFVSPADGDVATGCEN